MLDNTTEKFCIFLHKKAHFPKLDEKCARKAKEEAHDINKHSATNKLYIVSTFI